MTPKRSVSRICRPYPYPPASMRAGMWSMPSPLATPMLRGAARCTVCISRRDERRSGPSSGSSRAGKASSSQVTQRARSVTVDHRPPIVASAPSSSSGPSGRATPSSTWNGRAQSSPGGTPKTGAAEAERIEQQAVDERLGRFAGVPGRLPGRSRRNRGSSTRTPSPAMPRRSHRRRPGRRSRSGRCRGGDRPTDRRSRSRRSSTGAGAGSAGARRRSAARCRRSARRGSARSPCRAARGRWPQ